MILDRLAISLGYEYDPAKMDKFNEKVESSKRMVKGLAIGAIGLAASFTLLFSKLASNALSQDRIAKTMDITRESMVAMQRTSEEITGSGGAATNMLEMINSIRNSFKAGKGVSEDFLMALGRMGIGFEEIANGATDEALFRIAEGFQNLDEDAKDATTALLGLSSEGRNLLNGLDRKKWKENLPTKTDIQNVEEFEKSLKDVKQAFEDAVLAFGTPLFKKLVPAFKFLSENANEIVSAFATAADLVEKFGTTLGRTIGKVQIDYVEPFLRAWNRVTSSIGEAQEKINEFFNQGSSDKEIGRKIRIFLGLEKRQYDESLLGTNTIPNELGYIPVNAPASSSRINSSNSSGNNITVNQNINTEIRSDNIERAAEIIVEKISDANKKAAQGFHNEDLN